MSTILDDWRNQEAHRKIFTLRVYASFACAAAGILMALYFLWD